MTHIQAGVLIVEVGIIAAAALASLFGYVKRPRP